MITLYGSGKTRAFRVLWMLEELGLAFEHVPCGPRAPAVTALNASGKVPVMVVDGVTLTDSTAILTFLADRQGALTCPAGSLDRARQDGWTQMILDECDAVLWMAARHSFILPADRRMPAIKDSLKWEFDTAQGRIAARLGKGPFLMGDTMTVPDILLTHCLHWAEIAGFPAPSASLAAYFAAMKNRPAYQRAAAR